MPSREFRLTGPVSYGEASETSKCVFDCALLEDPGPDGVLIDASEATFQTPDVDAVPLLVCKHTTARLQGGKLPIALVLAAATRGELPERLLGETDDFHIFTDRAAAESWLAQRTSAAPA